MDDNIGFIGLGQIGKPMCSTLIRNSREDQKKIHVYDLLPQPVEDMVELGAIASQTPADIATNCGIICLCVTNDENIEQLLYPSDGQQGIFALAQKDTLVVIHSTVEHDNVLKWAADGKEHGVYVVDAAITGGSMAAEKGELCTMVGGASELIERLKPVLDYTAKKVVYGGDLGAGIILKLTINLINYIAFAAATEGLELIEKAGLSPENLYEIGQANGVIHPLLQMFCTAREGLLKNSSSEDAKKIFAPSSGLAKKDLDHALKYAQKVAVELPTTEHIRGYIEHIFLQDV